VTPKAPNNTGYENDRVEGEYESRNASDERSPPDAFPAESEPNARAKRADKHRADCVEDRNASHTSLPNVTLSGAPSTAQESKQMRNRRVRSSRS